jgi:hypothetical protein
MIALDCHQYHCVWVVIENGKREELSSSQKMNMRSMLTLNVQGDTLTATGLFPDPVLDDDQMLLVLPPKYAGKFTGGGVFLQITDTEVDFIEIQPFR